jgi:hypothetical protein
LVGTYPLDAVAVQEGMQSNDYLSKALIAYYAENQPMGLFVSGFGQNVIKFHSSDYKLDFEKYVEEQSGVWQQFLQDRVFVESKGVGAGILYDWAGNVPNVNMNSYPSAVLSKQSIQSQWLDNASFLTGGDRSLLQDMARNTYIYTQGQNPEMALATLRGSAGIGILDPVTIGLIIGAIVSIVSIIAEAMSKSKQEGDILAPQRAVGFSPVGLSLMPSEGDWSNTTGSGGSPSDTGTGPLSGANQSTVIGVGLLAAAAAYYAYEQSKKKK